MTKLSFISLFRLFLTIQKLDCSRFRLINWRLFKSFALHYCYAYACNGVKFVTMCPPAMLHAEKITNKTSVVCVSPSETDELLSVLPLLLNLHFKGIVLIFEQKGCRQHLTCCTWLYFKSSNDRLSLVQVKAQHICDRNTNAGNLCNKKITLIKLSSRFDQNKYNSVKMQHQSK